jgi:hypothetical protein
MDTLRPFAKGNLLKCEMPVLAGSADQKRKPKSPIGGQPTDMLTRDVLNSILPPQEFKNDAGDDLIQ